jgi:hypothetical protein
MNEIIDNSFYQPINDISELASFLEGVVSYIPYCAPHNWELTTNEFMANGGLCHHFAQFLNNVLSDNNQFECAMVSGLAYNKVIEGRNYLYGDQSLLSMKACLDIYSYKVRYYFCVPSTWACTNL